MGSWGGRSKNKTLEYLRFLSLHLPRIHILCLEKMLHLGSSPLGDTIKKRLLKRPAWIILGKEMRLNAYYGYTENPFSMSISPVKVRVWRCPEEMSSQEYVSDLLRTAAKMNLDENVVWKVYRVGSKKCPVSIDWAWEFSGNSRSNGRNLGFVKRGACG